MFTPQNIGINWSLSRTIILGRDELSDYVQISFPRINLLDCIERLEVIDYRSLYCVDKYIFIIYPVFCILCSDTLSKQVLDLQHSNSFLTDKFDPLT